MDLVKLFDDELELIREDYPRLQLVRQISLAKQRAINELWRIINQIGEQRFAAHQEAVNKAFYG